MRKYGLRYIDRKIGEYHKNGTDFHFGLGGTTKPTPPAKEIKQFKDAHLVPIVLGYVEYSSFKGAPSIAEVQMRYEKELEGLGNGTYHIVQRNVFDPCNLAINKIQIVAVPTNDTPLNDRSVY